MGSLCDGIRPLGFEFRIMCLEGSVISLISPSSGGSQFSLYVRKSGLKPDSFHLFVSGNLKIFESGREGGTNFGSNTVVIPLWYILLGLRHRQFCNNKIQLIVWWDQKHFSAYLPGKDRKLMHMHHVVTWPRSDVPQKSTNLNIAKEDGGGVL